MLKNADGGASDDSRHTMAICLKTRQPFAPFNLSLSFFFLFFLLLRVPLAAYALTSLSFSCGALAAVRHIPRSDLGGGVAQHLSKLTIEHADIVEGLGRCSPDRSHGRSEAVNEARSRPH